jgi:hypothetical protein
LNSCAKGQQPTYLKNTTLPRISKVAIVASVSDPKVSYSGTKNVSGDLGPFMVAIAPLSLFVFLAAMGTESAIRSGVDREHAGKVKEHVDLSHFEEKVAQSFMQIVKKGDSFQTAEYLTDKNPNVQQLSIRGYDAIIRLSVDNISLTRDTGEYVGLYTLVRGQMEHLSSGKVVWDRYEHVKSPEFHSLNYYKENGLKELDAMLERAARNLAYDFVYLK